MRRRRYASGVVNPFLPTEVYEAKRKALLETGSQSLKHGSTRKRDDRVVSIRINPLDCLSILDVLEKQGISTVNMSFAQAVKIVLASSLETFRSMGYIPMPDGFRYLERMAVFGEENNRVAMLNLTAQGNSPEFQAQPLVEDYERKKRRLRYEELLLRKQGDPLNWTEGDQAEFAPLVEEFYS